MQRLPVTSSNVASVGFDPSSGVLEVEFRGGAVYQYFDVPEQVYVELVSSSSVSAYFNQFVRDSYRTIRL